MQSEPCWTQLLTTRAVGLFRAMGLMGSGCRWFGVGFFTSFLMVTCAGSFLGGTVAAGAPTERRSLERGANVPVDLLPEVAGGLERVSAAGSPVTTLSGESRSKATLGEFLALDRLRNLVVHSGTILPMLGIFATVAIVFFVAERIDPARSQRVLRKGLLTDLLYCVSSVGIRAAMTGTVAIGFTEFGRRFLPGYAIGVLRDQPVWIQALSIIFVFDLIFYVLHRAKHHWRWLWRLHETHHSSSEMDWFSSVRFHPLEKLLDRSIYLFPLLFLGVSGPALLILAAFDATIASFSHANLNWRIGPLIYVFVGPEMHRWHHSTDPRRQRCNFGNNLSIFDWIFGTAFITRENPVSFGLGNPRFPEGSFVKQFLYAFRPFPRRRLAAPSVVTVHPSGSDGIQSPLTEPTDQLGGALRGSESAAVSCK